MSVEAMSWARRAIAGNSCKKAVLWVLANYADEDWSCFPSQATIAEQAEVGERTVRRILQGWEEEGLILRTHRGDKGGGRTSDRIYICRERWAMRPPKELPATRAGLPATHDRVTGQGLADEALGDASVEALTLLPSPDPTPAAPSKTEIESDFDEWYATYPRKKKPGAARPAYIKARKKASRQELLDGAEALARLVKAQGGDTTYTPYPSSWLNAEQWRDEETPQPNPFEAPPMRFG